MASLRHACRTAIHLSLPPKCPLSNTAFSFISKHIGFTLMNSQGISGAASHMRGVIKEWSLITGGALHGPWGLFDLSETLMHTAQSLHGEQSCVCVFLCRRSKWPGVNARRGGLGETSTSCLKFSVRLILLLLLFSFLFELKDPTCLLVLLFFFLFLPTVFGCSSQIQISEQG